MRIMGCRYLWLEEAIAGFEKVHTPLVGYNDGFSASGQFGDVGSYYFIPLFARVFDLDVDSAINTFYLSVTVASLLRPVLPAGVHVRTCVHRVDGLEAR